MTQPFTLSACAEMLWRDKPMDWRLRRLTELGFEAGIWNWQAHDLSMLEKSGARFSSMTGYVRGRLTDDEGARDLLATVRQSIDVGKHIRIVRISITLGTVALAVSLAWAMWNAYMEALWRRDGTVRVYVVTMVPEVAGRIVALSVPDNQFVHKGDALFEIDPSDYRIALEQAQAQAQRDAAALDYARANAGRQARLAEEGWVSTAVHQLTTSAQHQSEAVVALDDVAISKKQLDLSRTVMRSPVNGYVTNLLAQRGDYANVGQKIISVVDTGSFWVDGYFEESNLDRIHDGDPTTVKLMGYDRIVRGHVDGIARGINVPNAQPDQVGLASVYPIFTWVRLAQRVPVRIHIDQIPDGVRLVAGMTATVQIDPQSTPSVR